MSDIESIEESRACAAAIEDMESSEWWIEGRDDPDNNRAARRMWIAGREYQRQQCDPVREALVAFAENVRDNWGVLTGWDLQEHARAALAAAEGVER